ALSGRQGYMGFAGWFVAQGLDWAGYAERLRRMYRGDVGLMRELGVDYVVVGPWERAFAADNHFLLSPVFDDASVFATMHDVDPEGRDWRILRLLPARS